jgi:hypothetical protein
MIRIQGYLQDISRGIAGITIMRSLARWYVCKGEMWVIRYRSPAPCTIFPRVPSFSAIQHNVHFVPPAIL